jgi:hypothetical protein
MIKIKKEIVLNSSKEVGREIKKTNEETNEPPLVHTLLAEFRTK